jgi:hypothetical protein
MRPVFFECLKEKPSKHHGDAEKGDGSQPYGEALLLFTGHQESVITNIPIP